MKRGSKIGPYRVLEQIGRGAMGEVWLAEHGELGTRYALKVLGRHLLEDSTALKRFEVEMEGLARVDGHPGIVRVHSAGRTKDGLPWIAMEYVPGMQLSAALKAGLEREKGLDVILQVARALGHAHARGLVHRDVKPDNVILGKDGARLTDFGLAKLLDREQRLTRSQDLVGTPFYLAPEQANQAMGEIGPWSDVYSLGALLYEVLVGEPPHTGTTTVEVCTKVVQEPIVPPSLRKDGIPPAVEAVCLRALSRDGKARYKDGKEMAQALEEARLPSSAEIPAAVRDPSVAKSLRSGQGRVKKTERQRLDQRRLVLRIALGAAGLVLAVGLIWWGVGRMRAAEALAAIEARAREATERAGALERRLRTGGEPGEAARGVRELLELEAALPADDHPEMSAARAALARTLELARSEAAREAWQQLDVAAALEALGPGGARAGQAAPWRPWVLLLGGDPAGALEPGVELPPGSRAWALAWAGRIEEARGAIGAVTAAGPPPGHPAAAGSLAAELAEVHPELLGDGKAIDTGRDTEWRGLAWANRRLAEGQPMLAANGFGSAPPPGGGELAAAWFLGRARLLVARGDLAGAAEAAGASARQAAHAQLHLDRARALLLQLETSTGQAREETRAALTRLAPGLPGLARALARPTLLEAWTRGDPLDPEPLLGLPVGLVDRARRLARAGDRAGACALLQPHLPTSLAGEPSFLQLELRAAAAGLDGPHGLLLARAWTQAELARQGGSWGGAVEALALLERLAPLRVESAGWWLARAIAARTLHRPGEARIAAERALALAPGDPWALLERARALLAAEVHGVLPGAPDPTSNRLKADLARVRGRPDAALELAAAESLDPALQAFRAARDAAGSPAAGLPSSLVAREARLAAAEVLLEMARRRVLGGGARVTDPPGELIQVEAELEPLLRGIRAPDLARARARLGEALAGGEGPAIEVAEQALAGAVPTLQGRVLADALAALRLRALAGSAVHADAWLALAADAPARALWHLDAAAEGNEGAVLPAVRLAPWLPAVVLAEDYHASSRGDEVRRCRRLAGVARAAPSLAGLVPMVASLAISDVKLPDGYAGDDAESRLALALGCYSRRLALLANERSDRSTQLALELRTVRELTRSLQVDPFQAGVHTLLGVASLELARETFDSGEDPDVAAEGSAALACARAGLPWSIGPTVVALSLAKPEGLRAVLDELYLHGGTELLRTTEQVHFVIRSRSRREAALLEVARSPLGKLADPHDAPGLLASARALEAETPPASALALVLRLRAAAARAEAQAELPPLFFAQLSAHLRERLLGPEPLGAGLAAGAAAFDPPAAAAIRAGAPGAAAEDALRALWLACPAGELTSRPEVLAGGRPMRVPSLAPDLHRLLFHRVQPDGAVWETGWALGRPVAALRRLRALLGPSAPAGGGAGEMQLAWSHGELLLLEPQEPLGWREQLLGRPAPEPGELALLLLRASAFERGLPLPRATARLGRWVRALAQEPERARERPRLLGAALALVQATRKSIPTPPPALLLAQAELTLDLAGLEGGALEAKRAALAAARDDAEAGAGDPPRGPGQPVLATWTLARARALAGDAAGSAAPVEALEKALEEDPALLLPLQPWLKRDPWLAELRKRPHVGAFLGTWLPE